jgi:hypothetical protein
MIRYQLACEHEHAFEAWFGSIAAFEKQRARALVVCPQCGSTHVDRSPMAPAVVTGKAKVAAEKALPDTANLAVHSGTGTELQKLKATLLENSEAVGERFAEEARKIHFNEAEPRSIHGQASFDEARGLVEDGIPFGVLPILPSERN